MVQKQNCANQQKLPENVNGAQWAAPQLTLYRIKFYVIQFYAET